jgi:putative ABC transport system permease protein
VVAEDMARRYWPGRSALGGRLVAGGRSLTVIGVARDSRHQDLRSLLGTPAPYLYVNAAQQYWPRMTLVLRTTAPAAAVLAALQHAVRRIDPAAAPVAARTAREHVNEIFAEERTTALLAAALGLLALLLSIAGIYGVVSYWVVERTHEIGIRMALGAQRSGALRLVLGHAAALAMAGIAAGLALAFVLTRAMSGMLFGITARDPLTYAGAGGLLIAVALAAGYLPARRATRVDPMVALRYE